MSRSRGTRLLLLCGLLCAGAAWAGSDAGEPLTDFHREWVWSFLGAQAGVGGISLADLDGDGALEIVTGGDISGPHTNGSDRWYVLRYSGEFAQTWSSLPYADGLGHVRVVPGAGPVEVVAATNQDLRVYDGSSKAHVRSFATAADPITAVEIGDLDGVPGLEAVLCDPSALWVYDYETGAQLAARYGFGCVDLDLGQTDADPAREIAVVGAALGGYVLDGATLEVEWEELLGFGPTALLVDLDDDGLDELVSGFDGSPGLRARDLTSGEVLWEAQTWTSVSSLADADLDGDGVTELLYGDQNEGTIHVLEAAAGSELWTVAGLESGWWIYSIVVGDADGDGSLEILFRAGRQPTVSDRVMAADVETRTLEGLPEIPGGPVEGIESGDVDGDGRLELVIANDGTRGVLDVGGRLLIFDSATHALEHLGTPIAYNTAIRAIAMAQLDGDAPLEVCSAFGNGSSSNGLRCEDGATHETQWELPLPNGVEPWTLELAEVDGDPWPELLIGLSNADARVAALDAESGWMRWQSPSLASAGWSSLLRVGDVMGSAGPEVVALYSAAATLWISILDAATGAPISGPWDVDLWALDLIQLDGDAELEIVGARPDGAIAQLDPATGQLSPPIVVLPGEIRAIRVGDTTRDGVADLNVVAADSLMVWDGALQQIAWSGPFLGPNAATGGTLYVGNFDLDAVPEIALNNFVGFAIFESPLFALFADGFESGDTSAWSAVVP